MGEETSENPVKTEENRRKETKTGETGEIERKQENIKYERVKHKI